ncbi:hypothetical protein FACHB389_00105 [Nostoc calcicola FACHB-389]|nr:hypothetical protein [Nostoc calcicola FACHB-3891]OKH42606.1 hypothetical protein FACHB389_00105 [Nostoc calcicola FACHB-389]
MNARNQKLQRNFIPSFLMMMGTFIIHYLPALGEWNEGVKENGISRTTHTMLQKETCRIVWSNPASQKPCIFLNLDLKTDGALEIGFSPVGLHTGSYTFRTNKFRNAALTSERELKADVTAFAHEGYQQPYDTLKWQKVKGSCRLASTSLRCDVVALHTVLTAVHDFRTNSPKIQELFYMAYLGDTRVDFIHATTPITNHFLIE